jgi:hypothetical protein
MKTANETRLLIYEAKTNKEANRIIEEYGEQFKPKWNFVDDELPIHPEGETARVLTDGYDDWYVADFFEGEFYSRQSSDENGDSLPITQCITAWCYLPKLP